MARVEIEPIIPPEYDLPDTQLHIAIAARFYFETQHHSGIMQSALGKPASAPDIASDYAYVTGSAAIIEELLERREDPDTALAKFREWTQFSTYNTFIHEYELSLKNHTVPGNMPPDVLEDRIADIYHSVALDFYKPLLPAKFDHFKRLHDSAVNLARDYEVSLSRVYIDEELYCEATRETYKPYEYIRDFLVDISTLSPAKLAGSIVEAMMQTSASKEDTIHRIAGSIAVRLLKSTLKQPLMQRLPGAYAILSDDLSRFYGEDEKARLMPLKEFEKIVQNTW